MIAYTCHSIGINGSCGIDCPILLNGECDLPFEISESEYVDNDLQDLLEDYKENYRLEQEVKAKKEQIKEGNMNAPFKITKEFIANIIVKYYRGDLSVSNPVKMFIEYNAFDQEIISLVDSKIHSHQLHNLFVLDLFLNGLKDRLNYKSDVKNILKDILKGYYQQASIELTKAIQQHFYEADLNDDDFLDLGYNEAIHETILSGKVSENQIIYYNALIKHDSFPMKLRNELYTKTLDEKYLSSDVKECFIF